MVRQAETKSTKRKDICVKMCINSNKSRIKIELKEKAYVYMHYIAKGTVTDS